MQIGRSIEERGARSRGDRRIIRGRVMSINEASHTMKLDVGHYDANGALVPLEDIPYTPQNPPSVGDVVGLDYATASDHSIRYIGAALGGQNSQNSVSSGALSNDTPLPVAFAGDPGTGRQGSRSDHKHQSMVVVRHDDIRSGTHVGSATAKLGKGINIAGKLGIVTDMWGGPLDDYITVEAALDFTSNAATDVSGSSSSSGTATKPSREDHVHQGVHTIHKTGSSSIYGAVTLTEGANITLTQTGNDITIAATGGGGVSLSNNDPLGDGGVASAGIGSQASRDDHVHKRNTQAYMAASVTGGLLTVGSGGSATRTALNFVSSDYSMNAWVYDDSANDKVVVDIRSNLVSGSGVLDVDSLTSDGLDIYNFAAVDHTHAGVHTLCNNGDPQLTGDVVLISGAGISVTQTGNSITIATSTGGAGCVISGTAGTILSAAVKILTANYTLPSASLEHFYILRNTSGSSITINRAGSDTFTNLAGTTGLTSLTLAAKTTTMLVSDGSSIWYQFI